MSNNNYGSMDHYKKLKETGFHSKVYDIPSEVLVYEILSYLVNLSDPFSASYDSRQAYKNLQLVSKKVFNCMSQCFNDDKNKIMNEILLKQDEVFKKAYRKFFGQFKAENNYSTFQFDDVEVFEKRLDALFVKFKFSMKNMKVNNAPKFRQYNACLSALSKIKNWEMSDCFFKNRVARVSSKDKILVKKNSFFCMGILCFFIMLGAFRLLPIFLAKILHAKKLLGNTPSEWFYYILPWMNLFIDVLDFYDIHSNNIMFDIFGSMFATLDIFSIFISFFAPCFFLCTACCYLSPLDFCEILFRKLNANLLLGRERKIINDLCRIVNKHSGKHWKLQATKIFENPIQVKRLWKYTALHDSQL